MLKDQDIEYYDYYTVLQDEEPKYDPSGAIIGLIIGFIFGLYSGSKICEETRKI